mgnify:CR=1 FL=1
MKKSFDEYSNQLLKLRIDAGKTRYPQETLHKAPYKPILLLSIFDLVEQGIIEKNLIELTHELSAVFKSYCSLVLPVDRQKNISLPFFHLRSEKFWHLLSKEGKKEIVENSSQIRSVYRLLDLIYGASLDPDLFELIIDKNYRNKLRMLIITKYFDSTVHDSILMESSVNYDAFKYSIELLHRKNKIKEEVENDYKFQNKVRNQGFRRAVVTAYEHRCAVCGIRMQTIDGHTVVDGAHIIPWSISKDDRPQNGIALCKLCHWIFDKGLVSITNDYRLKTSNKLLNEFNILGYIHSFQGRELIKPKKKIYWPAVESIGYHRQKIFLS